LHVKLHQIPVCNLRLKVANQLPESKFREWKFSNFKHNNDFERILIELIPFQIPIAYLEAFKRVKRTASSGGYPDSPKLIWTSNSFYSDDVFKVWAAGKVEKGVLFLIGQHGGHYGQGKYSFPEYHELKICDHYLSWGWGGNIKKINPIGVFKNIKKENKHKYKHKALLVVSGAPRYSGTIISMPIAGQVLKYIDQQLEFYEELPRFISNDVVVRLYPHDYGWCQLDRWKGAFPDVEIDTGSLDFDKQIRSSKVIISGWNSTAYIESFLADIPTVLFWNFTYFELRDDAIKTFDNLKRAGILHDSPIAAAKHLGEIWDDVDAWWSRPDVVIAKSEFINKYAAQGCIVNKLNTFLKSL